jgi:hypothetical protein
MGSTCKEVLQSESTSSFDPSFKTGISGGTGGLVRHFPSQFNPLLNLALWALITRNRRNSHTKARKGQSIAGEPSEKGNADALIPNAEGGLGNGGRLEVARRL